MRDTSEPVAGREATEDCDAIEARIRSKINMDSASPADWIWETLAVLEAEGRLVAQPSVQRTQDELKAEMATLTAAETGSAWQLLYGLYGELPIPEKDGWKIAALLIRITAERGSK